MSTQLLHSDSSPDSLRRTPLYQEHARLGAKFTSFGGWEMPVQYSGLVDEHMTVRSKAGLFDVSHMGEIFVRGPKAFTFVQFATSNDVSKLQPGRAQYSLLMNRSGGVVDDIIVYQLADDEFLICVNAANAEKDFRWLCEINTIGATLVDASADFAQIALQGPLAPEILSQTLKIDRAGLTIEKFPAFSFQRQVFAHPEVRNGDIIVARTGYTGEDGFEIFCAPEAAAPLWRELLRVGAPHGIKPAGLGARDTLRLEACYPLYGHELLDNLSPLCSGLGWVIKPGKGEFVGRDQLLSQKAAGLPKKLVGVEVVERGIVREGTKIFSTDGVDIGWVTSGTKPPTIERAIGLAFVPLTHAEVGTDLLAEVRERRFGVRVVPIPFYKRAK